MEEDDGRMFDWTKHTKFEWLLLFMGFYQFFSWIEDVGRFLWKWSESVWIYLSK